MRDKIEILEHQLADIEHLELSLLQAMSEDPDTKPEDSSAPVNKRAADMKQRLLKRIASLKSAHEQ